MRRLCAFILIITCAAVCLSCGSEDDSDSPDRQIVLTTGYEEGELFFIGESKCYLPEAKLYMRTLETTYESIYGDEIMTHSAGDITVSDKLTGLSLSRLAQIKAMGLLAKDRGIALNEREIEKCRQAADRYMQSLSDADKADLDISYELLLNMFEDYALANKVYDDITSEISPEISDDEARTITIQRILFAGDKAAALQAANAVYSLIMNGTSFDSLIDDYNSSPESKYSFGMDTDEFSPEFVNACFNLSADEVSLPLITDEGVSIVKIISAYDIEETDANKLRIVEKRKGEAFDQIYEEFVHGLYSDFNSDLWDSQMFTFRKLDSSENFFEVYDDIFSLRF